MPKSPKQIVAIRMCYDTHQLMLAYLPRLQPTLTMGGLIERLEQHLLKADPEGVAEVCAENNWPVPDFMSAPEEPKRKPLPFGLTAPVISQKPKHTHK